MPKCSEKLFQHQRVFPLSDASDCFGTVQAGGLSEETWTMINATAFWVPGTEDDAPDTEMDGGGSAHGTGFERDDQRAVLKTCGAAGAGRGAHGKKFGMGGRVMVGLDAV